MKIEAKSFAKVNPHLEVTGRRKDGYHELKLSFLSVTLADEMVFERTDREQIRIQTDADIPKEKNLCFKAAKRLQENCSPDQGANIELKKEIPIGAGLGGGSSNAATTLICLNRMWECGLFRRELIEIGKDLGADIPFFFYGGYCMASGSGTEVQQRENVFADRLVIIISPPFSQRTAEVYRTYDRLKERQKLQQNSKPTTTRIKNDLEQPALELNPELSEYLKLLEITESVQRFGVSGSGSAVFGISQPKATPQQIRTQLEDPVKEISKQASLKVVRPTNNAQMIRQARS